MNALIYENPAQHDVSVANYLFEKFSEHGFDTYRVTRIDEAASGLIKYSIEVAVIHHEDFREVIFLRKISPKTQYVCYSGLTVPLAGEGTMNKIIYDKMKSHYDHILMFDEGLDDFIRQLR